MLILGLKGLTLIIVKIMATFMGSFPFDHNFLY